MGSWYLLLYVSFVTVTLVIRHALHRDAQHPTALEGSDKAAPQQDQEQQA